MRLSAPKVVVFLITLIVFAIALLNTLGVISILAAYNVWLYVGAYVLLALACIFKGL